ncbi:MAG TPA: ADP-glyceromanno-heptose 6-epimerase [Firmicutes bacterium]|nr:ADP-glyceromanno-heptose 6-epimerase [Bacillota bacterium]
MFIVTGGAGFIGSAIVWKLNEEGIEDIIIVDELGSTEKWKNLRNRRFSDYIHKDKFIELIRHDKLPKDVTAIIHMGACSSTTELNADYLTENNYRYSRYLAEYSILRGVRFIYASSAATYGDGSNGFSDDIKKVEILKPLNMYGFSKQMFDLWVLKNKLEGEITGLKFFNVFGPNEYHKGEMSSVVYKAFFQVQETGKIRLFKSYNKKFKDGEQKRDFIFIKDCTNIIWWLINHREINGIFNLGTGKARTWIDLANSVFFAMEKKPEIEFIEMPKEIRQKYQYFTEADMKKLKSTGCPVNFRELEDSVADYIRNYLSHQDPYI